MFYCTCSEIWNNKNTPQIFSLSVGLWNVHLSSLAEYSIQPPVRVFPITATRNAETSLLFHVISLGFSSTPPLKLHESPSWGCIGSLCDSAAWWRTVGVKFNLRPGRFAEVSGWQQTQCEVSRHACGKSRACAETEGAFRKWTCWWRFSVQVIKTHILL